ncbi:MAG: hypothetical protein HN995_09750 [Candidatus Marinimicrobia bacterium]|nr:hypothetical protein [Candidatus Neomarinimicrobiota bacterium]MBT3576595.1 hypothetical protein [Candidatus Neomarinimicrobiota bacterium]MBT3680201.1 hypothetical protein [Candidatus Neomarinimicrobiota bacterium]MBT3949848.1 hypothetical protein [Candidatus Neomarinimicrobiota bacterium]MBT4253570.1 hypothetical protein [Candidatus Neomarinimicrobiota bacterium]
MIKAKLHNYVIILLSLLTITFLVLYSAQSMSYLNTPVEERYLLKELDSLYGPSGLYGHGVGFLAAFFMFLLWLYIIRKRWNRLRGVGRLSQWLKYHMWFGIVAPLLAGYHAAFKFEGLIGVMYWAMIAVMLSGIVGRYLYGHIPRRRDGHEMSMKQINTEKASKLRSLQMEFGISPEDINKLQGLTPQLSGAGTLVSLYHLAVFDVKRRYQLNHILKDFELRYGVSKQNLVFFKATIEKQLIMSQRVIVLDAVSKVFHWWHVIHKPFAYAIFIVLTLHIILTLSFGFTWIF